MYFTMRVRVEDGTERDVEWRDGVLSGDAYVVAGMRAWPQDTLPPVPIGCSPRPPWEADFYATAAILGFLWVIVSTGGNLEDDSVPGIVI